MFGLFKKKPKYASPKEELKKYLVNEMSNFVEEYFDKVVAKGVSMENIPRRLLTKYEFDCYKNVSVLMKEYGLSHMEVIVIIGDSRKIVYDSKMATIESVLYGDYIIVADIEEYLEQVNKVVNRLGFEVEGQSKIKEEHIDQLCRAAFFFRKYIEDAVKDNLIDTNFEVVTVKSISTEPMILKKAKDFVWTKMMALTTTMDVNKGVNEILSKGRLFYLIEDIETKYKNKI